MADTEQTTATVTKEESPLESLRSRYGYSAPATSQKQPTFDQATLAQDSFAASRKRMSSGPQVGGAKINTGDLYKEVTGIQLDLAELSEQFGKLNINFSTLFGSKKLYTMTDAAKIGWYNATLRAQKARQIKIEAAGRKGNTLETLVNQMGEIVTEQKEKAIKGEEYARTVLTECVEHMIYLDKALIQRLRDGAYGHADYEKAQKEISKLEVELQDFDKAFSKYDAKLGEAKISRDIDLYLKITDEVSQLLDMKQQVLHGKLAADQTASEIRRKMLEASEGVQSAKVNAESSKLNYQAISLWIDSMGELVTKYKHMESDMIPVFKIQSKIAVGTIEALQMKEVLVRIASASQRLMDANAKLVTALSKETWDLIQNPLYDVEKAQQMTETLKQHHEELNQQKLDWINVQSQLSTLKTNPHYVAQT